MSTTFVPDCSVFNTKQHAIVKAEIDKLLAKGVIILVAQEMGEFISTIFLRPKKGGTHRTILNLKEFNEFVAYHHFKMDNLEAAISMMKPGCFMASVDLRDAYYTVKQVAEVIAILVSNFHGAKYGPLHYRNVERDKYLALVL